MRLATRAPRYRGDCSQQSAGGFERTPIFSMSCSVSSRKKSAAIAFTRNANRSVRDQTPQPRSDVHDGCPDFAGPHHPLQGYVQILWQTLFQYPLGKMLCPWRRRPPDVPPVTPMDLADRACAAASGRFHGYANFGLKSPRLGAGSKAYRQCSGSGGIFQPMLKGRSSRPSHSKTEHHLAWYFEVSSIALFTCRRRGERFREAR